MRKRFVSIIEIDAQPYRSLYFQRFDLGDSVDLRIDDMWISPVRRLAWGVSFSRCHRGVAVMEADLLYYARRSAEERAAAALTPNEKARLAHLELARCYAEQIARIEVERRRAEFYVVTAAEASL